MIDERREERAVACGCRPYALMIAALALTVTSCSATPAKPRPEPERLDYSQLYEDFGDFRMAGTYPASAAQIGQEGWVLLEFSVGTDGCVSEVAVSDASPRGYFEEAAMAPFINHCFAHPKVIDGEPVESNDIPFLMSFRLID